VGLRVDENDEFSIQARLLFSGHIS
jgi:hypothetical protein